MIGVYEIRNTVTGDCYIGSSVDIFARWAWHTDHLERGKHPTWRLQMAWQEFGRTAFSFSVIQETSAGDRYTVEMALIQERRPAYNGQPEDRSHDHGKRERRGYTKTSPIATLVRVSIRPPALAAEFVEVREYSDGHTRESPLPAHEVPPYCPACGMPQHVEFRAHPLGIVFAVADPASHGIGQAPAVRGLTPDEAGRCLTGQLALAYSCAGCDESLLFTYLGQRAHVIRGVCHGCGAVIEDVALSHEPDSDGKGNVQVMREVR